jgi:iron complex transport system ATP-binding protein
MTTIEADRLMLRRGGATIVAELSLSLGPTGSVAVIGPNGAGKSMLMKMLSGIEPPSSGRIRLDAQDLARLSHAARAQTIGYLPQHFEPHWDLIVAELVRLGAERAAHAQDAIEKVMATFELTTLAHRRWSTLSGGERARVLLAMVLVIDPPVLLADEPGASLDIRHRIDVVKALVSHAKDHLAVVVMHDLDLAFRYFDRVIVMNRGGIVADAPARDLVEDPRLDATFGVTFERLSTAHGPVLQAI